MYNNYSKVVTLQYAGVFRGLNSNTYVYIYVNSFVNDLYIIT